MQMDLLNKLLEHRRIPGENKSQRYATPGVDEAKGGLKIGKFDTNEKEFTSQNLSTSISSDHVNVFMMSRQRLISHMAH